MFTTERLTLRGFRDSDMDISMEMSNNLSVQLHLTSDYIVPRGPEWIESTKKWHAMLTMNTVVTLTATGEFMGFAQIWPISPGGKKNREGVLGLGLLPEFWNKGYGTEVTKFMVDYAFRSLALHRLSLTVFEGNPAAIAVYKKAGFVLEGTRRKANWVDGKWESVHDMAILDEEWAATSK